MADRETLHIKHIAPLKEWLKKDGWEIKEPKGYYERVRASKGTRHFIAYIRADATQHLSVG
jgi:hypothetical protein